MNEIDPHLASSLASRFNLVRQLGQGGMGQVYLAEQIAVGNRPVALKVLSRKLLDDPDFLLRFQNEAASTGRIHHPNVVTIYESGQADDGTPYIAMEFLEGESLRQALARRGPLPVPEVAEILQQAARGLNAAHKLGIIHRDLKPDNIFLTYPDDTGATLTGTRDVGAGLVPALPVGIADPGRAQDPPLRPVVVKLVDFGIAKLRESGMHTQTGTVLGTPAYMSFEQASGMRSDELDARSDVYSLGVVVYEMLTGRTPFQSDTPVGYLRMHMQESPPPFRTVNPHLVALPEVESAVMNALSKDRNQRYGSVLEFAHAFAEAAKPAPEAAGAVREPPLRDGGTTLQQTVPPTARPTILEAKRAVSMRSRLTPWVGVAALAVVLVLGGWYLSPIIHPRGRPPIQSGSVRKPKEIVPTAVARAKLNPIDGLMYTWIPRGIFMMGCSPGDDDCPDDEKPLHQVTISKGFWIGQTEVTAGAFRRFAESTGTQMPDAPVFNHAWAKASMPIVNVSWDDAQAYCRWIGGRLPTEAEWEYAARGGSTDARYGDVDEIAWYESNSEYHTHEVAQKRANGFGLFDMLGNAREWVNDWYDAKYYRNSPSQDPSGPASGQDRVLRGGCWVHGIWNISASLRLAGNPTGKDYNYDYNNVNGFRCAGEMGRP